jgi:hypothetical protein
MSALRVKRVEVYECVCSRCEHEWTAVEVPAACAACKSKYWNKPRVRARKLGRPAGKKKPRTKGKRG